MLVILWGWGDAASMPRWVWFVLLALIGFRCLLFSHVLVPVVSVLLLTLFCCMFLFAGVFVALLCITCYIVLNGVPAQLHLTSIAESRPKSLLEPPHIATNSTNPGWPEPNRSSNMSAQSDRDLQKNMFVCGSQNHFLFAKLTGNTCPLFSVLLSTTDPSIYAARCARNGSRKRTVSGPTKPIPNL